MSSLIEALLNFNFEDIKHYGKGKMGLSITAVSRIVKIPTPAFGRAIGIYSDKTRLTSINKELSEKLAAVGFPVLPRKEWSTTGIPDIAVGICISHYAHHAKKPHPEVIALSEYLTARSVRDILQEKIGYKEEEEKEGIGEQFHKLQSQFNILAEQNQEQIKAIAVQSQTYHQLATTLSNFAKKTSKSFPGMLTLFMDMCETEAIGDESKFVSLPFSTRFPEYFTAPNWLDFHAPHFTQRQKVNFCKDLAGLHRDLVDNQPKQKGGGSYLYNHSHQPLLIRVKESVEKLIVGDGAFVQYNKTNKRLAAEARKTAKYIEVQPLTHREQSLIGQSMKATELAIALGFNIATNDISLTTRLAHAVKQQRTKGKIPSTNQGKDYIITPELIQYIKNWFNEFAA